MIGGGFTGGFPWRPKTPQDQPPTLGVVQSLDPVYRAQILRLPSKAAPRPYAPPSSAGVADRSEALASFREGRPSVRWVGPLFDGSGYAEASRNYVAALSVAGVAVTASSISFEDARADYGSAGRYATVACGRKAPYAVNIVHLTPEHYPRYRVDGCYNIGMFAWETDILPEEWIQTCRVMDEIWVPCQWTAEVARASGVNQPIHVFGHCANLEEYRDGPALSFPELRPEWFKFYSIFQWTERKNPRALLRAYLSEFTDKEPVVLVLKTYRSNYSTAEQEAVISEIDQIKREVGGNKQPRLLVILDMMSRDEILAFHRMGDCFVLLHRAEGWGLPLFEACLMERPVITTAHGGNMEFTRPETCFLVKHTPTPVQGMDWIPWYKPYMKWADPDINDARSQMRYVFLNRQQAAARAKAARLFVSEHFSWERVGMAMRRRIEEILKKMG